MLRGGCGCGGRTVATMQLTHLGHSCLLLEAAGQRVLIDPGAFSDYEDVADLNAVFVTHQHFDHLDPEKVPGLLERSPGAKVYADPETVRILADKDIEATSTADGPVQLEELTVTPVGSEHAVITEFVPRIGNVGLYFTSPGEPTLFHPGDALDGRPAGDVDLLAVPVSAPWCAVKETVAFVRAIAPGTVVPIHDALLTDAGRGVYLQNVEKFGRDGGLPVTDLRGAGPVTV